MGVKLVSSGGGSVEIAPPVTASSFTATMPAGTGTVAVQGASTNIVSGTAVASTSGTSIDFTSIPSWVKRITVMFQGLSTNGASEYVVRIGDSSGVAATGYTGAYAINASASLSTTGFGIANGSSTTATIMNGTVVITSLDAATYKYTCMGMLGESDVARMTYTAGAKTLAGALTTVRITTINGTDTFDAGSINILYE